MKKFLPASMLELEEVKSFINAVNNSYQSFERDNQLNAHAFSINEIEYAKINEALKLEVDLRRLSIRELKEAIVNMKEEGDTLEINTDEDNLLDTLQFLKNQINSRIETEQRLKNSQEGLYTSAKRLSQLISNLHNGILLEDEHRKIIVTNQLFCDMFSIPVMPSNLVGADCTQSAEQSKSLFKYPDQFVNDVEKLIEEKKIVTGEILELADGRVFTRDYMPIFIDDVYKGHLWKYDDITQQQENERQLKRLSLVASANEEGILFTDPNGKIIWINEGYKILTGYEVHEIIGKTPIEMGKGPLSDKTQLRKMVDAYFVGNKFDIESRHYRK
ncbi:MAG: PAS domain S-box protein, partial [Ferruginibacter sp.]